MFCSYDDSKDFDEFAQRDPWEQLSANLSTSAAPAPNRPSQMSIGMNWSDVYSTSNQVKIAVEESLDDPTSE